MVAVGAVDHVAPPSRRENNGVVADFSFECIVGKHGIVKRVAQFVSAQFAEAADEDRPGGIGSVLFFEAEGVSGDLEVFAAHAQGPAVATFCHMIVFHAHRVYVEITTNQDCETPRPNLARHTGRDDPVVGDDNLGRAWCRAGSARSGTARPVAKDLDRFVDAGDGVVDDAHGIVVREKDAQQLFVISRFSIPIVSQLDHAVFDGKIAARLDAAGPKGVYEPNARTCPIGRMTDSVVAELEALAGLDED